MQKIKHIPKFFLYLFFLSILFAPIAWTIISFTSEQIKHNDEEEFNIENDNAGKVGLGVYIPEIIYPIDQYDQSLLDTFQDNIGKNLTQYLIFESWGTKSYLFDEDFLSFIEKNNLKLIVTWEPWQQNFAALSDKQAQYSLESITNGAHDEYINSVKEVVKNHPEITFIFRFAHEMNTPEGSTIWFPWQGEPENYKKAFIYVHDKFSEENVKFMFNPFYYIGYADPLLYYPGDQYVDFMGITAINLGDTTGLQGENYLWRTCDDLVGDQYNKLVSFNKPIYIAELMSTNVGGDKGVWYSECITDIANDPLIVGLNFMQLGPDISWTLPPFDWRVTSTDEVLQKVRKALENERY